METQTPTTTTDAVDTNEVQPTQQQQETEVQSQPELERPSEDSRSPDERLIEAMHDALGANPTKAGMIRWLHQHGTKKTTIARLLGISYQHVYNTIGFQEDRSSSPEGEQRGSVTRSVIEAFDATGNVAETARRIGKPYQQVYQILLINRKIEKRSVAPAQQPVQQPQTEPIEQIVAEVEAEGRREAAA